MYTKRTVDDQSYSYSTLNPNKSLQKYQFSESLSLSLFTVVHFQQLLHECSNHTLLVIIRLFLFLNFTMWRNDDSAVALISNFVIIVVYLVLVWSINAVVTYISHTISVVVMLVRIMRNFTIVTLKACGWCWLRELCSNKFLLNVVPSLQKKKNTEEQAEEEEETAAKER